MSNETSQDSNKSIHKPKNIVICYDGTGNEYGENNTNVVKVFESIERDERQIAFYDPGVGTISFLGRRVGRKTGILLGRAFGYGLTQNIEDGYEYLMNRFRLGDKIFLFGFSRGAFTVRLLADMIYRFGLLQKGSKNLVPYVTKYYNDKNLATGEEYESFRQNFKKAFCQDCRPHFIGVWDTVGSLGYINGRKFHDHKLNPEIKYAYQAIAIDEKRSKFKENLWDESGKKVEGQEIEQVWFAGCHSDVGWWSSRPTSPDKEGLLDKERGLPDITFAWMMDMAEEHGLILKPHWVEKLEQDASGKLHESRKGIWLLWLKEHREIPEGSKIHRSVIDRLISEGLNRTREAYRPENLLKGYELKELEEKYRVVTNDSYQNRSKA